MRLSLRNNAKLPHKLGGALSNGHLCALRLRQMEVGLLSCRQSPLHVVATAAACGLLGASTLLVAPSLADLVVLTDPLKTNVVTTEVHSGGPVTIRYTVRNDSDLPVWRGTD